jgi:hypothetical protein
VRTEDRAAAVQPLLRVLHVRVVDAVRELLDELGRVEELVGKVRGVEVDAEALAPPDRLERPVGGGKVIGDLGGVHLEGEAHALLVEDVDDRIPALGEVVIASLDLVPVVRREGVEHVPDR